MSAKSNLKELQAVRQLLDYVNRFYEDPKNKQAYDAWKAKEEANEDHDHP